MSTTCAPTIAAPRPRRAASSLFPALALLSLFAVGCGNGAPSSSEPLRVETTSQALGGPMGEKATGSIPVGMPARFTIGLMEGIATDWMSSSGVPWDVRYQYLSKGWVTNWGHGERDGEFALDYFYDSYEKGLLPAVEFYQIVEEPGGGESAMLSKVQNPATMKSYFEDFKILMERAKEYGAPVQVLVEADGTGFLQLQSKDDPETYAAVADSGVPELAGLPNTVAGWGLAFLQLKKAVGADKVLLGLHVSGWATNLDVMQNHDIANLEYEVYRTYTFLSPLGLVENHTGLTYDFLVGDPSDRDAGYYEKVKGMNKWWSTDPNASIDERSMNRYAEWLRLWNVRSGKRWVLWQIPIGNSNHLDVDNAGGPREGYRDNRAEYFLGGGIENLQLFADAGVMSLMFGPGMWGMSGYENDFYTDGQLYVKTRAKQVYDRGGLDLAPGREWTPSTDVPNPGPPKPEKPKPPSDAFDAQYEWEGDGALGWTSTPPRPGGLSVVTGHAFRGERSLALAFNGEGDKHRFFVKDPSMPTGTPYVVFHVFVPTEARLLGVMAYVQQGPAADYAWVSNYVAATDLVPGEWNLLYVNLPEGSVAPFSEMGIEFESEAPWTGTAYLDSVGWAKPASSDIPEAETPLVDDPLARDKAGHGCSVGAPPRSTGALACVAPLAFALWLSRRRRSRPAARSCRPAGAASARRAAPRAAR
jgi:hypothetical protein